MVYGYVSSLQHCRVPLLETTSTRSASPCKSGVCLKPDWRSAYRHEAVDFPSCNLVVVVGIRITLKTRIRVAEQTVFGFFKGLAGLVTLGHERIVKPSGTFCSLA